MSYSVTIKRALYIGLIALLVTLTASVFLRRSETASYRERIDCAAVKTALEKKPDKAQREALQVDLRECLRSGFYRDWQVSHLFYLD